MLFDALDGFAARIFNAGSMHGLQMDSLADMVTFGVAPAVVVAIAAHSMRELNTYQYTVVWIFCAIYIACAALRLAEYNVHAILEKKSGEKFSGLPSPGAAAGICGLVILMGADNSKIPGGIITVLPAYSAFLGLLMVSHIPYQHVGRWLLSVRRNKKRLFVLFLILAGIFYQPILVTVAVINLYILSGPLTYLAVKLKILPEYTAPKET